MLRFFTLFTSNYHIIIIHAGQVLRLVICILLVVCIIQMYVPSSHEVTSRNRANFY